MMFCFHLNTFCSVHISSLCCLLYKKCSSLSLLSHSLTLRLISKRLPVSAPRLTWLWRARRTCLSPRSQQTKRAAHQNGCRASLTPMLHRDGRDCAGLPRASSPPPLPLSSSHHSPSLPWSQSHQHQGWLSPLPLCHIFTDYYVFTLCFDFFLLFASSLFVKSYTHPSPLFIYVSVGLCQWLQRVKKGTRSEKK